MLTAPNAPPPPGRLLKMAEVVRETSLHRATIYRRIAAGEFPRGRSIGGGRVAWTELEVEAWKRSALADPPRK
jgi:prophage regulatory protein